MALELTGKVVKILPLQSGQGKNGTWKKQEIVMETQAQYPKKVLIQLWGDKVDNFPVSEGELITASIDFESREYNGRWYTDVRAWKITKNTSSEPVIPPPNDGSSAPQPTDDLPF